MSVIYVQVPLFVFPMASRLPLLFSCALLASAAGAAELGDQRVGSYMGQPLVADIELTLIEHPAARVEVRLAHPNVYRGANIGMPHVLSTLNMSVMQRDGRQFLHVTSRAPVESSHLHLYVELTDGGQRSVRLATLWLTPDPNPAPLPAPVAAPAPVPVGSRNCGTYSSTKVAHTTARLHFSQPRWRRMLSSMVISRQFTMKARGPRPLAPGPVSCRSRP